MSLTAEQITQNWDIFLNTIKLSISGQRREILLDFYNKYEERFALMPASGKTCFHNAFPGGYVDHVIRVWQNAMELAKVWEITGATMDFTGEELAFVALNHDLGKFGTEEHEYYIDQDSNWHKDRGEIYKLNPAMQFMKTSDRSLFLLQQIGVSITQNEYLGITLHDGLYEESNKSYYISYNDDYRLRTNLPYIVHQADLLAARIEHDGPKKKTFDYAKVRPTSNTSTEKTLKEAPPKKSNNKYSKLLNTI